MARGRPKKYTQQQAVEKAAELEQRLNQLRAIKEKSAADIVEHNRVYCALNYLQKAYQLTETAKDWK